MVQGRAEQQKHLLHFINSSEMFATNAFFMRKLKMNTEQEQRLDLGHFKVNWPRPLKREECSSE